MIIYTQVLLHPTYANANTKQGKDKKYQLGSSDKGLSPQERVSG